ncbi:MAG: hypothetical protein JW982_07780 [Spirochaetes bacterium]|nr:hypothetical protein [Spirochaetota bacterium]
MKKIIVMMFLLPLFFCCKTTDYPGKTISGGYEKSSTDSSAVKEITVYVERELQKDYPGLKIIRTDKAETQIVAGTNFRLECRYSFAGKKAKLRVIVYEKLTGEREITLLEMKI